MKKAFKRLNLPTRKWISKVKSTWQLDDHHERLLILAGQAWDRAQDAKILIDTDGSTILDRFGQLRPHPMIEVERQSMLAFARLVREVGLDLGEPDPDRLPYRPGNYK